MICSTNKYFREILYNIKFCDIYCYNKIKDIPYYSSFKNIVFKAKDINIPGKITHVIFR
ncbi:putative F-box and FNIP repeat-containing protein [Megavirus courdo7]|uniref:Putative F-box and FNIP repeat-containing protein n=1 Tax=Megavirus courdo7 TaxID=1128135 RepID=H2E9K3_9VIRU|nr:putative F-box and FNIP repeat-containing protein [Megavirus courdo7]